MDMEHWGRSLWVGKRMHMLARTHARSLAHSTLSRRFRRGKVPTSTIRTGMGEEPERLGGRGGCQEGGASSQGDRLLPIRQMPAPTAPPPAPSHRKRATAACWRRRWWPGSPAALPAGGTASWRREALMRDAYSARARFKGWHAAPTYTERAHESSAALVEFHTIVMNESNVTVM